MTSDQGAGMGRGGRAEDWVWGGVWKTSAQVRKEIQAVVDHLTNIY